MSLSVVIIPGKDADRAERDRLRGAWQKEAHRLAVEARVTVYEPIPRGDEERIMMALGEVLVQSGSPVMLVGYDQAGVVMRALAGYLGDTQLRHKVSAVVHVGRSGRVGKLPASLRTFAQIDLGERYFRVPTGRWKERKVGDEATWLVPLMKEIRYVVR